MMTFEISEQMMMVVINALGNHPYKDAAPVIAELQRQFASQRMTPQGNGQPAEARN